MFSRSIKAYFLIISLFLSVIISSNVYANTALNLGTTHITVYAGSSPSTSWTASNGDKYRVITKNCPSWVTLSPSNANQSTGNVHIRPPVGTTPQPYSCTIEACSTVWGTCAAKSLTVTVESDETANILLSPTSVNLGETVTFVITGENLPDTLAVWIDQCANPKGGSLPLEVNHISKIKQTFQCIPSYSTGKKDYKIKDKSGGKTLKEGFIDVLDSSQGTTVPTKPQINLQTTASVGEKITFSVKLGTNIENKKIKVDCRGEDPKNSNTLIKYESNYLTGGSTVEFSNLVFNSAGDKKIICTNTAEKGFTSDEVAKKITIIKEEIKQFNLILRPDGKGSLSISQKGVTCNDVCTNKFNKGTVLTITNRANSSYNFKGWGGDCSNTGACKVTMNSNKTVSAIFEKKLVVQKTHTLTFNISGKGQFDFGMSLASVRECNGNICTVQGSGSSQVPQILIATPDTGYKFSHWIGIPECTTESNCNMTVKGDMTIGVVFTPINTLIEYKLSVSIKGQGTVTSSPSGINCTSNCSNDYKKGTTITLTATPKDGYILDSWDGACASISCEIRNIDSNKFVTASFKSVTNEPKITSISPLKGRVKRFLKVLIKGENLPESISMSIDSKFADCIKANKENKEKNKQYVVAICIANNKIDRKEIIINNGNIIVPAAYSKISFLSEDNKPDKIIEILPLIDSKITIKNLNRLPLLLEEAKNIFSKNNTGYELKFLNYEFYNHRNYANGNMVNIDGKEVVNSKYYSEINESERSIALKLDKKADTIIIISLYNISNDGRKVSGGATFPPGSNQKMNMLNSSLVSYPNNYTGSGKHISQTIVHEIGHHLGLRHGHNDEKIHDFKINGTTNTTGKGKCNNDGTSTLMFYYDHCSNDSSKASDYFSKESISIIKQTADELANSYLK